MKSNTLWPAKVQNTPGWVFCTNEKAVYLETDGIEHDQYLTNLSWSPDGKTIVLAIVNRAQNNYDVVAFNAKMESAVQRSLASATTSGLNQSSLRIG